MAQGWFGRLMDATFRSRDKTKLQTARPPRVEPAGGGASFPPMRAAPDRRVGTDDKTAEGVADDRRRAGTAEPDISALFDQFLRADPPQMRKMLEGRDGPPLLHPAVEAALRGAAKQAADRGEKPAEQFFGQHADLLAACRDHGVAAGFAAWAMTQNNLGNALSAQGERRDDPDLLGAAVEAYRRALKVYSKEETPQAWAMTQNNLGSALCKQGDLRSDPDLLADAVTPFLSALEVYSKEQTPRQWGMTQNNLGNALFRQGELRRDAELLTAAVVAYTWALEVYSKEETPQDWANTVDNLGNALEALSELRGDPNQLDAAVAAHRRALEVYSKEQTPQDWAAAQNNLGNALRAQGERRDDPDLLGAAVEAYRRALEVYSKEQTPQDWAAAQNNLGNALRAQGERRDDPDLLGAAVEAYRRALEVRTLEHSPAVYLATSAALGRALIRQASWPDALDVLQTLLSAGVLAVLSEQTRQRQQVLLRHLSGAGDDLAIARLNLPVAEKAGAVAALAQGRGIMLGLAAAIAGAADRPDLAAARADWRGAQRLADAAEERTGVLAATVAIGGAAATAELDRTRAAAAAAREEVHHTFHRFRDALRRAGLDAPPAVDCAELAAAVPASGALVMPILPSHGNGRVLVLAGGSDRPALVPAIEGLTGDWLDEQLREWFAGYVAFRNAAHAKGHVDDADIAAWNRVMATVLTEVGKVLMGPLDRHLREQVKLAQDADIVLMLPGRLAPLPVHAAPVNASGDVFLDYWVVRQVASPHQLLAGDAALAARRNVRPTLLAVTNPTADEALGGEPNPALPFFAEDARIDLREGEAKVERVKETAQLKEPGWTHYSFFCHGVWDHNNPDQSGLQMNDYMLSVAQFRDLNLSSSRFAMIAACETALHNLNRSPDEFASVPTALAESGVPCVTASLWPVGVGPTRQLVEGVFRRLIKQNMLPAAALRAAQFELRGKDWRFGPVLGWGSSTAAKAATAERAAPTAGRELNTGRAADAAPPPDLFSWAGFACYGG